MPTDPHFPWPMLRAVIGGASALDLPRLEVRDRAEAVAVLDRYGFHWDRASERAEVQAIRSEAVAFLEEELLDASEQMPTAIRALDDVPALLQVAAGDAVEQAWACALLRVMHILAHASSHFEDRYGPAIRTQILDIFHAHLHEGPNGLTFGTGPEALPIDRFEVKARKERRSVVLKLLHKRDNVAAAVFDRVGVRLVTPTRFDALLAIRFLRVNNLIVFANVWPARSRNTLVDLAAVEAEVTRTDRLVADGALDRASQLAALRAFDWPYPADEHVAPADRNVFSSSAWRSIQVTCRQMIRVPDPQDPTADLRFFFPFEVQVLDREADAASRDGRASHTEYKRRQREAVRRRVLGPLVR